MLTYKCQSKDRDDPKGPTHVTEDGDVTLCGKNIPSDNSWYLWGGAQDHKAATCRVCKKKAQEIYEATVARTGNYVDRFFLAKGQQSIAPELCSPRDIAALFFEFLKNEGAIAKPKKVKK
jgi:hypothetical protein